jgi:hypothetical protein
LPLVQANKIDFNQAFVVLSGDDTPHHDNNKKLTTHLAYATKLFKKTLATFTIEAKGEP